MIVLCRNDHFRLDHGGIPMKSMRAFKSNLAVLNSRYSEIKRRLLETCALSGLDSRIEIDAGEFVDLSFRNLVRDELVEVETPPQLTTMSARREPDSDGRRP
jgi:hypothetical protein